MVEAWEEFRLVRRGLVSATIWGVLVTADKVKFRWLAKRLLLAVAQYDAETERLEEVYAPERER